MNGKDVKKIQKIVITLFLVSVITISPSYSTVSGKSTNILVILGPSFCNSYFINNDIMEEYGWNVDIAGTASNLISCYNKPLQNINTDHIISEVDDSAIEEYDAVIVTSGGHWEALINHLPALNLISNAYSRGLVVGGICTGVRVVASAGNIVNGSQIASHFLSDTLVNTQNGTVVYLPVVSDNGIITAGFGGGTGSGPEGAPNEEFCEAIKTELESRSSLNIPAIVVPSVIGGLVLIGVGVYMLIRFRKKS